MMTKKPLERYSLILADREKARYLLSSDLEKKIKSAKDVLRSCRFCERRCGVNRLKGQRGYCGVLNPRIASEFLHWGEERALIPSYTIFFSGCTFRCVYCQNWDISQYPHRGVYVKPKTLASMISSTKGSNVNWVGGDPSPNIHYILQVLDSLDRNIPQIWNSNMYLSEEAMGLLDGVIDVYLTDFKYGNDRCAERLSDVREYTKILQRNHLMAEDQCEVLIRHLVLPEHLECCTKPILEWISENMKNPAVNIMEQYRPEYKAMEYEELRRGLTREEYMGAVEFGTELGLHILP